MSTEEIRHVYQRLCIVCDDIDGMCSALNTEDRVLAALICQLVKMKMGKAKSTQQIRRKFKDQHGHSTTWDYLKRNPDQYAKMLERNRLYKQKKRDAAAASAADTRV